MDDISNSMGLFLQKTNITRDYLEDITAANSRMFYPKEIWGKYAPKLAHLRLPEHSTKVEFKLPILFFPPPPTNP